MIDEKKKREYCENRDYMNAQKMPLRLRVDNALKQAREHLPSNDSTFAKIEDARIELAKAEDVETLQRWSQAFTSLEIRCNAKKSVSPFANAQAAADAARAGREPERN